MSELNLNNMREKLALERAKELSDEVYKTIMDYFRREEYWRCEAAKSHDDIAAEIENGFEAENRMLKNRLRFSIVELNSDKELDAYNAFCEKHMKCRMDAKTNGGMMPYVTQYGTGIGVCTTVCCQICGEKENITDTTAW